MPALTSPEQVHRPVQDFHQFFVGRVRQGVGETFQFLDPSFQALYVRLCV